MFIYVWYLLLLITGAGRLMAESFVKNAKLTTIDVSGNQVNHTTSKLIRKVTKKNRDSKKVQCIFNHPAKTYPAFA